MSTSRPAKPGVGSGEERLEVSAQLLTFEHGLYSVTVTAPTVVRGASGMILPCVRLDPVNTGQSRSFISALSDSALVQPGDPASYLRVPGSRASVLLTIYKLAGNMPAPQLRIALVQSPEINVQGSSPANAIASEKLCLTAYAGRSNDMVVGAGIWAGQPGARASIEGFSVAPEHPIECAELEYQALLGSDWTTPWATGGEFCGSRGLSLPILGLRIRLKGAAAATHTCCYWGSFVGSGETEAVYDGDLLNKGEAHLEALRVVISQRVQNAALQADTSSPASLPDTAPGRGAKAIVTESVRSGQYPNQSVTRDALTKGKSKASSRAEG